MNDITEALSLASDRKREVEVLQVCVLRYSTMAQDLVMRSLSVPVDITCTCRKGNAIAESGC